MYGNETMLRKEERSRIMAVHMDNLRGTDKGVMQSDKGEIQKGS